MADYKPDQHWWWMRRSGALFNKVSWSFVWAMPKQEKQKQEEDESIQSGKCPLDNTNDNRKSQLSWTNPHPVSEHERKFPPQSKKRGDSAVRSTRTGRRSSVFFFSTLCACCKNAWMWNLSSINVSRQSKVQAGAVGLEVLYILESCWVRVFLFFFPPFLFLWFSFYSKRKIPMKEVYSWGIWEKKVLDSRKDNEKALQVNIKKQAASSLIWPAPSPCSIFPSEKEAQSQVMWV